MRLHYVNDGVPAETTALLSQAAWEREVEFVEITARAFDFDEDRLPAAGDLLYRPAVSLAAIRVEQFLYSEDVATFYADPAGPLFGPAGDPILHQRAGIPIPRTVPCASSDRALLRGHVEHLGGFPVLVKLLGYSGGVGMMVADSYPALFSLVDHLLHDGRSPLLCAFVRDSTHWRVVVVGTEAVAAYRNRPETDDFRTYAGSDLEDYPQEIPAAIAALAVRSVEVLRYETGGVDLLEHPSGRLYFLEANFPCYFPQAQLVTGVDIAGKMLDHLTGKASSQAG